MRLDQLLSKAGFGSRKHIKKMLKAGEWTLNDLVLSDPSLHIDPKKFEHIHYRGKPVRLVHTLFYLINKPSGYITATNDRHAAHVNQLLPPELNDAKVFPLGRLDKDTTGLLCFTNDGQLAHRLLSPKFHVPKTYWVKIQGEPFCPADIQSVAAGIQLDDGLTKPAHLSILKTDEAEITLSEGRFHQVKRMMIALNKTVIALKRIQFADIHLPENLALGKGRYLTDEEITGLYEAVNLSRPNL